MTNNQKLPLAQLGGGAASQPVTNRMGQGQPKARKLMEEGGWAAEVDLALDMHSVFAAATAAQVKITTDRILIGPTVSQLRHD